MTGGKTPASARANDQSEVIAFLSDPRSYPGRPAAVECRETHGALVFLAGEEALKIKRAVRFTYLDFSTLEKRRDVLNREFAINRAFAPELYLGVVPITREANGKLVIGGGGVPVEWALRMRRFDEAHLLSAVAERGELTPGLCRQIAEAVYAAHLKARVSYPADPAAQYLAILVDVSSALDEDPPILPDTSTKSFGEKAQREIETARAVLQRRAAGGCVRRCHGDLHLSNIVLWKDHPLLFDAIEFDEAIATVDTLYDLAFLLMDLEHRGYREQANAILNRYLWCSNARLDLEGLEVLPAFLALRAGVRAMVNVQRARQVEGEARAAAVAVAQGYVETALRLLEPRRACLVSVGGLSGTGKSTLAAALAPKLGRAPGALHLRSDIVRKSLFVANETDRLPADAYTREVTERVYALLCEMAECALKTGHAVVADAVYANPRERETIEEVARRTGVDFCGLWLDAPAELLKSRVDARRGDASDATSAVVEQQLGYNLGDMRWIRVDAGGTAEATLGNAVDVLTDNAILP